MKESSFLAEVYDCEHVQMEGWYTYTGPKILNQITKMAESLGEII